MTSKMTKDYRLDMPSRIKGFFFLLLLSLSVALSGCGKTELFSNIPENEANEMISLLIRHGIDANKQVGEEGTWVVMVQGARFDDAVDILESAGYPKEKFQGIGKVFQKSGLVSSPTEERIRFMHALSQELSETISQIDGVLVARVQIVLPENDPYSDITTPSSASVFIKHRSDSDVESAIPKIKNFVVNSIEGLTYDRVSLASFPSDEWQRVGGAGDGESVVMGIVVSPKSAMRLWMLIGGLSFLLILSIGAFAYFYTQGFPQNKKGGKG